VEIINEKNAAETAKAVAGLVRQPGPSSVRRSAAIGALAAAMAKAQAELRNPPKDSVNPHFKSRYADLATVRDAVVPVLAKNGLAVMQFPCELDDAPALTTVLAHASGEWYETTMKLRPLKNDPQGVGSALTYGRRYALQAIAGVAADDDDDDGHAASQPPRQQQAPASAPVKEQPKADAALPANGQELHKRLQDYDAKLAGQKLCVRGALLAHVVQAGVKAGFAADMTSWTGPAIPFAVDAVKA
jgi:hypothetical protein